MKKVFLALFTVAATAGTAAAQVEIGLQLTPSITSLRADSPTSGAGHSFKSDGSKLNFGGGLVVDYFIGENYAINTGLFISGKGGKISYTETQAGGNASPSYQVQQNFTTQYLELPVGLKLFTNEVTTDVRVYFQANISAAVPIGTRINGDKYYKDAALDANSGDYETKAGDHVFFIDSNASLGFGAEYQLAKTTKVFGGFSYHRGLIDADRYFEKKRDFDNVSLKNSSFALDLGIKF